MNFKGKKFKVVGQIQRCKAEIFICTTEDEAHIVRIPAAITNYNDVSEKSSCDEETISHFTIFGLNEVAFILENTTNMSTE